MLKTRVMPCLLLSDGRLVKTIKFRNPTYISDPLNAIRIYNQKEVDELILLDITATRENSGIPFDIISDVTNECFMPLTYGGGVQSTDDIRAIFNLGVEKVAINSTAVENPQLIQEAAATFGNQSIIVSIDVKKNLLGKYQVFTHGGTKATGRDPVKFAIEMEKMGAGEILLTSIDKDGTWDGFDTKLIKMVTDAINIPLIACGGAGQDSDFTAAVKKGGCSAIAAGSMFVYRGKDQGVLIKFPSRATLEDVLK